MRLGAPGGRGNSGAFVDSCQESGRGAGPGFGWDLHRLALFEVTLSKLSLYSWDWADRAKGLLASVAWTGGSSPVGSRNVVGWGTCQSHASGQLLGV